MGLGANLSENEESPRIFGHICPPVPAGAVTERQTIMGGTSPVILHEKKGFLRKAEKSPCKFRALLKPKSCYGMFLVCFQVHHTLRLLYSPLRGLYIGTWCDTGFMTHASRLGSRLGGIVG